MRAQSVLIRQTRPLPDVCREYGSLATALNSYIGYAKAAEIVQESTATGQTILDLAREKKLLSEKGNCRDPRRQTHDGTAASLESREEA